MKLAHVMYVNLTKFYTQVLYLNFVKNSHKTMILEKLN